MRASSLCTTLLFGAALLLDAGCGDGVIGRDCPPDAPGCAADAGVDDEESFRTDFPAFTSQPYGEFRVVWALDNACADECASQGMLLPAAGDAAWSVPREPIFGQLVRVDGTRQRADQALAPPSAFEPAGLTHYVAADAAGGVVAHMQWDITRPSGVRAPGPDELQIVAPDGRLTRVELRARGEFRLPLGAIGVGRGYLLFAPAGDSVDARLFGKDGEQIWRADDLPPSATHSGGTAVEVGSTYVLGVARGAGTDARHGLLWLDARGERIVYAQPTPATWRAARLLRASEQEFLVAAQSDIVTPLSRDGYGNIDVARFRGAEVVGGVRIMRACYHDMVVRGFAREPGGELFVSTVAGDLNRPRGLICRVPRADRDDPRCYQAPEAGLLIGEIVATSPTTLFAVSGDRILRIELPE